MVTRCLHDRVLNTCTICSPETRYRQIKYQAEHQRNLEFKLTLEEFIRIVAEPCTYCGVTGEPRSIDRRNNFLGYVGVGGAGGNCYACCGRCNKAKGTMSHEEFLS